MESGKIKTLFTDVEKTEALFPRTKVSAVSDNNGVGLEAVLADKASKSFVTNKIAEAQLSGGGSGGNIDLSGYVTKDDLSNIDFPVDSVNGKTGAVTLSASNVGAAPAGYVIDYYTASSENEIEENISDMWNNTPNVTKSVWEINILADGLSLGGGHWFIEVNRTTAEYGTLFATCYGSVNAIVKSRTMYGGIWKAWVDESSTAFAPAGYGLGTGCKWVASMDNISDNGWYECDLGSMGYFVGIVTNYSGNSCIQHMWSIDTAGTKDVKEIQRHIVGNVIQPWEWVNPPMNPGVEYRTTERWNGKAVYTMLINCGSMPTAGNTNRIEMPSNINGWIDKVLRVTGTDSSGDTIPYSWQGEYITEVSASRSAIYIYSSQDFSSNTAYVQIFYTRY